MCIFGLITKKGTLDFIICFSRDENPERPFEYADGSQSLLFPLDVDSTGTWFGVNQENGNFACLTNVDSLSSDPVVHVESHHLSRGMLLKSFLENPTESIENVEMYRGFNLLWGNLFEEDITLRLASNKPEYTVRIIEPGCMSVSNGQLDRTKWPKVRRMEEKLLEIYREEKDLDQLVTELDMLLLNEEVFDEEELLPLFEQFVAGEYSDMEELTACQSIKVFYPNWKTCFNNILIRDPISKEIIYKERYINPEGNPEPWREINFNY